MSLRKEAAALYDQIDFSGTRTKLDRSVFITAHIGYSSLLGSEAAAREILSICDYSLSSNIPRLWVIDMKKKKLLYNTLVAHGQGTGEEYATRFSNNDESHQTSLGFFITKGTYFGNNGYSLRLEGMDNGYNSRAMDRAIVIHGADYVSYDFIRANKRLGRSWGCPALPREKAREIIDRIKEGTVFYAYYPDKDYLASSKWLNEMPLLVRKEQQATPPLLEPGKYATGKKIASIADSAATKPSAAELSIDKKL